MDNILSNDDSKIALEIQKEQEKHQIIENNKLVLELQKQHEQQIAENNSSKNTEYSPLHKEMSKKFLDSILTSEDKKIAVVKLNEDELKLIESKDTLNKQMSVCYVIFTF